MCARRAGARKATGLHARTRSAPKARRRSVGAEALTERKILSALDLITALEPRMSAVAETVRTAAERVREAFASPNVVGVGIAEKVSAGRRTGALALTFYVEKKVDVESLSAAEALPPAFPLPSGAPEGILVDVVEIGRLRLEAPRIRRHPVQPSYSIGHVNVTAGTLGAVVTPGKTYRLLSNSHVLADSGQAAIGDQIVYPGPLDGGVVPADVVGTLAKFHPFQVGGEFVNTVDCAVAKVATERLAEVRSHIPGLGVPAGVVRAQRGMRVTKVGRTTGRTSGEVRDVHFRFVLDYPGVGPVGYRDQVLCTRYTDGGDSGSLVLERGTNLAVGLHFAGADGGSVFNPIQDVLRLLRVGLVTEEIGGSR